MMTTVLLVDFVQMQLRLPGVMALVPEVLSGIALVLVLNRLATDRQFAMPPPILVFLLIMALHLCFGAIISDAQTGPLIGGLRAYLRYMPFFLLPMVYDFSQPQLRNQLRFLMLCALIQLPIALLQRFVFAPWWHKSGDVAKGTFATGSLEAIFLLSCMAVTVGCQLRGFLTWPKTLILCAFMVIPSTVGEVKGVFFLLPLAVLIPMIFNPSDRSLFARLAPGALALMLALGTYIGVSEAMARAYDHRLGSPLEFYFDLDRLAHYIAPQLAGIESVDERHGRLDKVVEPFIENADEPLKLFAGVGMGALNRAPISMFAADDYLYLIEEGRVGVSWSIIIWEIGAFGALLVLVGLYLIWREAKKLRFEKDLYGPLSLGMLAVIPIFIMAFAWKNVMVNNPNMYLFAYFCGLIVAASYRRTRRQAIDFVGASAPTRGDGVTGLAAGPGIVAEASGGTELLADQKMATGTGDGTPAMMPAGAPAAEPASDQTTESTPSERPPIGSPQRYYRPAPKRRSERASSGTAPRPANAPPPPILNEPRQA